MTNVVAIELCEWPDGCRNRKAPPVPTGGNPPRYCQQDVQGQRHDARERFRKFGRKNERPLPPALPEARPGEGLRAEMDRTQLAVEALLTALDQHGDAEAVEERIAAIEREATARVQAADAKATQALADNDQKIAAVKREIAVAEATRDEALAEAAMARDANTELEDQVVPRLEATVAGLQQQVESEQAAHAQAIAERAAEAEEALQALRSTADARIADAEQRANIAADAARTAEREAGEAKASTQAAEAVSAEQRQELARQGEAHQTELARLHEENAAELAQVRAEAQQRMTDTRQELDRLTEAHASELARANDQAEVRLTERAESLAIAHAAQLEAREARIAAAEQLARERAAERERLEHEIRLLGDQLRLTVGTSSQRQAGDDQPEDDQPTTPTPTARAPRRRAPG